MLAMIEKDGILLNGRRESMKHSLQIDERHDQGGIQHIKPKRQQAHDL